MNKAMNQPGLIGLSMVVACIGVMIATTARASTSATAYYQLGEADTSDLEHTTESGRWRRCRYSR